MAIKSCWDSGDLYYGWATIVEIEVEETEPGILDLKPVGEEGKSCKKRFLHLDGLGIGELCRQGEDLLILAGPTMDLDGTMRIYRLKNAFDLEEGRPSFSGNWQTHGNTL